MLLLATMINYMDRQTLANLSVRITSELQLSQEQYGDLELAFGWSFAIGSLCFGVMADRLPVLWLYPAVVILWSAVGVATGFASDFTSLLVCRAMLGFFEAGHWPCALRTTQAVLNRENRMLGNSILQSGGAIGAIVTPLIIGAIIGGDMTAGAWRRPFIIIGTVGAVWVIGWFAVIRSRDLVAKDEESQSDVTAPGSGVATSQSRPVSVWWEACFGNIRFWKLVPLVVCINITWHLIRVWLPKFLQEGRGIVEAEAMIFNSVYFVAADIGCLSAGVASLWLVKRGMEIYQSRLVVLSVCSAATSLTMVATLLPSGMGLYVVLMIVGAGAMGLFPCYYSLAQEVCPRHTGKSTGVLAAIGWLLSSPMQKAFGRYVDATGSFDVAFALVGLAPFLALGVLLLARSTRQRDGENGS